MSLEENKAIVRLLYEELNKQDPAVIDTLIDGFMAPDFVDHSSEIRGREQVKQAYITALKDYRDLHRTIEDIIAEGVKCGFLKKIQGQTLPARRWRQHPFPSSEWSMARLSRAGVDIYIKLLRQCSR